MRFLIETGNESHTTSWQKCRAYYMDGSHKGKDLYTVKNTVVSQEWVESNKHQTVVKTVFELPEGTEIVIDYDGFQGPENFIIRLDATQEVQVYEIGTSRLRTYSMKGRYKTILDLVQERQDRMKKSQEEGF